MALFKIFKGPSSNLNDVKKTEGYCYFTTDENKFYIDVDASTRVPLNSEKSEKDWVGNTIHTTYAPREIAVDFYLPPGSLFSKASGETRFTFTQNITSTTQSPYFYNHLTNEKLPYNILQNSRIDIITTIPENSHYTTPGQLKDTYGIRYIQIMATNTSLVISVYGPSSCTWEESQIALPANITMGFQSGTTVSNPFSSGGSGEVSGDASTYATKAELQAYSKSHNAKLTGAPQAPTANAGTNTDQIATTAFVTTAIANALANLAKAEGGSF